MSAQDLTSCNEQIWMKPQRTTKRISRAKGNFKEKKCTNIQNVLQFKNDGNNKVFRKSLTLVNIWWIEITKNQQFQTSNSKSEICRKIFNLWSHEFWKNYYHFSCFHDTGIRFSHSHIFRLHAEEKYKSDTNLCQSHRREKDGKTFSKTRVTVP